MKTPFTAEYLRSQDTNEDNFHYQLHDGDQYELTQEEMDWLNFIDGKYCIADHLRSNMKDNVYTVDVIGMSEALINDGLCCKGVMLSDKTVLQAIFFQSAICMC